jgi:3',5'-cyclic AMP phosphodiesterase CpdA
MTNVPVRVAVMGDMHFGQVDDAALAALLRDLRAEPPALIVIAGDLTQRARSAEFEAARAFIGALPSPSLVIPGNHDLPLFDLPRRLLRPYGRYARYISADLEPTVLQPELAALGVDATRRLSHKQGVLDRTHVERVAQRLRQAQRPFRLVAVHQPLAAAHEEDREHVTRGAEHALSAWLAAGADLFVGGHVHRGYCLQVGRAPGGIVVQAGTAISTRRRHGLPNSYFRIELQQAPDGARRMHILRRDHDAQRGSFATRRHDIAVAQERDWQLTTPEPEERAFT